MAGTGPLSFISLNRFATVQQGRFEGVGFTGKVTFTLVVNLSGEAGTTLNGAVVGELYVRGSPDNTLDSEFGWGQRSMIETRATAHAK